MKKVTILLVCLGLFTINAQAQFGKILDKAKSTINGGNLSQEEIGNGLKSALDIGVDEAVSFLSAKDGYYKSAYKIVLPKEAQAVISKLKAVPGFNNVETKLVEKINRAAEDAAVQAKPIFIKAIKDMSFSDAMNILMGNKDAATRYLEKSTYDQLYNAFKPIIVESLDKVNAREYWKSAVTQYNKIPFAKKTNPELDDHVTKEALAGMFGLVEKKEAGIREDKSLRTNDLLEKVFAKQDR